jgi:hypothetical protein
MSFQVTVSTSARVPCATLGLRAHVRLESLMVYLGFCAWALWPWWALG